MWFYESSAVRTKEVKLLWPMTGLWRQVVLFVVGGVAAFEVILVGSRQAAYGLRLHLKDRFFMLPSKSLE
jgi:hypothetical protein